MQETQVQSLGLEDLLEKETAAYSSILARKIPRMEPGRLQSMGSQRVGHISNIENKNSNLLAICGVPIFPSSLSSPRGVGRWKISKPYSRRISRVQLMFSEFIWRFHAFQSMEGLFLQPYLHIKTCDPAP